MTQQVEESKGHLRDYWRVVWQGKWVILVIALVVVTLVAVATFLQTPVYRATAAVEIQPRTKAISPNADFSQLGATSWSWAAEDRYLNTQMEIVRGREIAKAVLEDLGLESHPQFASQPDPAAALASMIGLEVLLDTYVLEISIHNTDRELAALLANGVARAYIDFNIRSAVDNARRVIDELYTQIEPIKKAIAEKEQTRLELARQNAFYLPEAQESSVDSRLRQLQQELTDVQIARGQREAIFNAIEEIERRGGSYESLPEVADDPTIRGLKDKAYNLQQEIEELASSYREGHPKLVAAQSALNEIPAKIEAETEKIITTIKTQYAIDKRREIDLEEQLRLAREDGLGLSQTSSQIEILDAEIKEDRRIYELITSRIKEIDLNQQTLINNIRMLEEATVPRVPVRPRKVLNLAAGLLLGLLLGVGAVFFVDYLDNTIRNSDDVERYLSLPLLAMVPKYQKNHEGSSAKEAFQTLRTSILFASKSRSLKSVLVTSAGPSEGKSRTAVNLAQTLARAGDRVVLIDCDLRRPTIHTHFGMDRSHGLTNYLVDREAVSSWLPYLKNVSDVENLKVLTCGPLPPNPVELFGSERFIELLDQVCQDFDWVVIDSPPIASLADSVVLGSLVNMAVLVIKQNENDRELIRRSVEQLRKTGANVIGAVLNAVDLRRVGYHDYYYAGYEYESRERQGQPRPSDKRKARLGGPSRS